MKLVAQAGRLQPLLLESLGLLLMAEAAIVTAMVANSRPRRW